MMCLYGTAKDVDELYQKIFATRLEATYTLEASCAKICSSSNLSVCMSVHP